MAMTLRTKRSSGLRPAVGQRTGHAGAVGLAPTPRNAAARQLARLQERADESPASVQLQRLAGLAGRKSVAPPVTQRAIKYGPGILRNRTDLAGIRIDPQELFNVGTNSWKKKLGSDWKNATKRKEYIARRVQILDDLLDGEEVKLTVPASAERLKQAVLELAQQEDIASTQVQTAQHYLEGGSGSKGITPEEASGSAAFSMDREVDRVAEFLLRSRRAFPAENIESTARSATGREGHGFLYELQLAESALEQSPDAKVQFGKVSLEALKIYLGDDPLHDFDNKKISAAAADVVVWTKSQAAGPSSGKGPAEKWSGDFIQAKSIKFSSLHEEMRKASNQLAGITAKGNGAARQIDREVPLYGAAHMTSIFIEIYDGIQDFGAVKKEAKAAIDGRMVKSVVISDGMTGIKYAFPGGHEIR